jgi:hypothetical protein
MDDVGSRENCYKANRDLRLRLNSVRDEGVESKHWHASEVCAMFEGCGVADDLVMQVLNRLYERRLIEALDPNVKHIGVGDRVAIKDSGLAHIELVLNSPTYVEQTALTTGVNELFTRDEMRRNNYPQKMEDVRDAFVRYLLKIDAGRLTIPTSKMYDRASRPAFWRQAGRSRHGRARPP